MSAVTEQLCREVLHLAPRRIQAVRPHLDRVVAEKHVVYVKYGSAAETGGRFWREAWAYRQCPRHRGARPRRPRRVAGR